MIRNYIKVAIRNLLKQKFYSVLNILGLSIGISSCLFILLYIHDELSYDQFHEKGERIYRVNLHAKLAGQEFSGGVACAPFAFTAIEEFPEVENAVRLHSLSNEVIRYGENVFTESEVFFADSTFFEVFTFPLVEGEPKTALTQPHSIVLTEAMARKYFGDEPAMGKILTVGDYNAAYKVTGIVKDPPENAHFHFDMLYSMSTSEDSRSEIWVSNNYFTYLLLHKGASSKALEDKLPSLVEKYVGPQVEQFMGINLEQFENSDNQYGYFLQPMLDIHLHSRLDAELDVNGDIMYVYIFAAIAAFILLIACINFMNLSTARSANRAKEVGVRKTLGSLRSTLMGQFLAESILVTVIAFVLAIFFTSTFLSAFNSMAGKALSLNFLAQPWTMAGIAGLIIVIGVIAGSYPAFYLSSFKPVEVLKGRIRAGVKSGSIRNILVVFQFFISITLIVCTALVYQQLEYARNVNLGFDKENVIIISNAQWLGEKAEAFKQDLLSHSQIINASLSNSIPPKVQSNTVFRTEGTEVDHLITFYFVDHDYIPTLGMELAEGRNFSREFSTDTAAVILNEAAVREFGFDEPLHQKLWTFIDNPPRTYEVVGVVKNFNFETLRNEIRPMAILLSDNPRFVSVRISPGNMQETLGLLESQWKAYAPNEPFEYTFMDEDFDALFRSEQRLGKVFTIFTGLAIFIACLGLLGLAAFTAEQRTKEIGVRKVMGASVFSVVVLLSKDFTKLVIIAFVIAIPVSYFVMENWLEEFAYRISIGVGTFLLAGVLSIVIAWFTVSWQSVRAARVNPVKSLRSE